MLCAMVFDFPHMSSVRVKDIFLVTPILFLPEPSRRPPLEKTKPNWPSLLETPTLMLLLFNIITLPNFDLGNLIQTDLFSSYHVSTWIYNILKAIAVTPYQYRRNMIHQ